jgi:hypothetical protein
VRFDDDYESHPNTLQYDSANYQLASNNFDSARGGVNFGSSGTFGLTFIYRSK